MSLLNEPMPITKEAIKELISTDTTRVITSKDIQRIIIMYKYNVTSEYKSLLSKLKLDNPVGIVCNTYQELFIKDIIKVLTTDEKVDFSKYLALDTSIGGHHTIDVDFKQTNNVKLLTYSDEICYLSTKYNARELALFTYLYTTILHGNDIGGKNGAHY